MLVIYILKIQKRWEKYSKNSSSHPVLQPPLPPLKTTIVSGFLGVFHRSLIHIQACTFPFCPVSQIPFFHITLYFAFYWIYHEEHYIVIQKESPHSFLWLHVAKFNECPIDRNLGCFQNVLVKSNTSIKSNGLAHRPFCICAHMSVIHISGCLCWVES